MKTTTICNLKSLNKMLNHNCLYTTSSKIPIKIDNIITLILVFVNAKDILNFGRFLSETPIIIYPTIISKIIVNGTNKTAIIYQ